MTRVPLERSVLTAASRWFAARALATFPEIAPHAFGVPHRDRVGEHDLQIEVPSPTGDPDRALVFWMADDEPSLGFGPWHTHATLFGELETDGCTRMLEHARAIFADQFVVCRELGGTYDGRRSELDLREPMALVEELTSPYSCGTVELQSWGGTVDRRVTLADL
jgi:hypothetical protein